MKHVLSGLKMKEFLLFVQIITIISLPKGEGAPKPVAFYPLNAVHNTRDISGNGLPAGIASGVTLVKGPDGRDGGAYYFSGTSSSYIEIPYHAMIDTRYSLTVLAWVRPESQGPILQYYRSDWGVHFWVVEPTPKLFVRVVTRSLQFTNNAMGGNLFWQAWYFVGFSYDYTSGRLKLFLDGVIVSELYIGTFETATNRELRLGAVTFDSRIYRGRISCLQIYNTALSWNDIRDASGACNDVPSAPPKNIRILAESTTSVKVTWEDVPLSERNGIILGFYLMFYYKTNTLLQTLHLAPDIRSRVFSGLEVYREYSVKMFSYTVRGHGTISNMLSGYTGELVPVVAPYGLTGLSDSPYSVQLSWQFNGSDDRNVLGILRGFRVFYGDAKHPIPGDVRDGRVPDLWPFTVYNFRLAGYTTAGDGPKSDTITIRTQGTVPSASPENIRISAASPTSVNVTWEDVPLPNRNGIILGFYLMFYFKTNTLLQTLHLAPNIRSRVFSGLEVHRQYSVKMFSYTVHGNGTISNMLSGYTGESELWPCFYFASIDELTQAANRIWYRLDGEPPRQIMTRSPKSCLGLCGWMKGTHPQRETGPVTRDLCFASGSGSCEHEALVTVRQCYGYFVYKFLGLPSGKLRISTEQGKHLDTPLEVLFHQRPGHHLTGHVFYQESPVLSPTQCVGYCLVSGERCKSFNYNSAQDNGICQLNNATATKYDQHISSNQEWGYYEPITVTFV